MTDVKSRPCFLTPNRMQPEYPLFIFLPGMDGTGRLLRSQTAGLEVAFDVRCLMIPPEDLTNWDGLSEQVVSLIHLELAKNPNRPVYLCGESFGGCLAIKVAWRSPQLFHRVILVNPASSFHLRPWNNWASYLTQLLPPGFFPLGALGLLPFLASLGRMTQSDRQDLLKTMRSVPPKTVLWRLSLIRDFDVDDSKLHQLSQPVLLIASVLDRLLPSIAEARRLVKVLPQAEMVILPYSGHACLLEADIKLYEIMQEHNFLEPSAALFGAKNEE